MSSTFFSCLLLWLELSALSLIKAVSVNMFVFSQFKDVLYLGEVIRLYSFIAKRFY
jgi:hypothetical protein